MRFDPNAPGLVLSPHLDDAVLSAWTALRRDGRVEVATVFAGVPPDGTAGAFDGVFGTSDSAALVQARRAEDRSALAMAGRTPTHLDGLDAQYRGPDDALGTAPEALAERIAELAPTACWIVAPMGIGRHADHLATRAAAVLLAGAGSIPLTLFADLPYATTFGWPSWVTGEPADPHLVPEASWAPTIAEVGAPEQLAPIVHRLDEAERAAKLEALRCYRTQWAALEGGPHRRISNPLVSGFEVHWTFT